MVNGSVLTLGELFVSKSADGSIITVGDESVEWSVKFGKDLVQFKNIDDAIPDEGEVPEDVKTGLEFLARTWFTDTCVLFDAEYLMAKQKILAEWAQRIDASVEKVSAKEARVVASLSPEGIEN